MEWHRAVGARRDQTIVYVCICNGVTERQIREAAANGVRNVAELTMRTGCGANCGSCLDTAVELLDSVHGAEERPSLLPIVALSHAA